MAALPSLHGYGASERAAIRLSLNGIITLSLPIYSGIEVIKINILGL